jgi:hypothetical protein
MKIGNWLTLRWQALFPIIAVVVSVGIARLIWWQFVSSFRPPLGVISMMLIGCSFPVITIFFVSLLLTVIIQSIRTERSLGPAIILAIGTFLAFQIPLPASPDTPEKLHFLEYRADYEATIELARNRQLTNSRLNCSHEKDFRPPDKLRHVSLGSCITVNQDTDRGLTIFFYPFERLFRLAYIEYDDVEYPCGRDLWVEQKIEAHWYVCYHDWN